MIKWPIFVLLVAMGLLFHLDLPRFDIGRRDRRRVFAREAEEREHGVRLVALDVGC